LTSADFELVMSLPAMSLELRFWICASRKGGTGGGEGMHLKCANSFWAWL